MHLQFVDKDDYMLTKLLPEQVAKLWDVIKYGIDQSLPPLAYDHPDRLNRILSAALCNQIEVWVSYKKSDETRKFEGVVVTKILYDDASNTRNLLIYCLYGYNDVSKISWKEGIETLAKYAKACKCSQVIAYTPSPYIIKIVKALGGDASYTFLSFDVNEIVKNLNNLDGG